MALRPATLSDMATVHRLVNEFWCGYQTAVCYEPETFIPFVRDNLDNDDFLVLLLNETDGLLIGCITETVYASARVAKELLWYTRHGARGRGLPMIRAFERWARSRGAVDLYCTIRDRHPAMDRLGFVPVDVGYTKRLTSWNGKSAIPAYAH